MKKRAALDPVTQYATDVAASRVVASRLVRLACARHLKDLKQAKAKGLDWRPGEAQRAIDFFPQVLCLPEASSAGEIDEDAEPEDGVPFTLQPWQQFIVGSLMGWYTAAGFRRFRDGYIEGSKGSGKTPMGAGVMLYLLVADGKRGAQVYFAAVTRDQAKLAHTDAEKMVAASPLLRKILTKTVNNLAFIEMGSFLRAISSEGRGLDGKRVHGALIDEEHEHPTDVVVSKMRRGTKGDQNALVLRVTNSGFDRLSVCWRDHEYSKRVLEGTVADESWFAFVCGLDPCAKCLSTGGEFPSEDCSNCDDWRTEGPHWLRACPNLGVSVPWQYYRDLVHQAKGRPDAVNGLLRFQFCVWTSGRTQGFDMTAWHACDGLLVPASELVGLKGYGGLDLGQTDDFSAFVGVWRLPDGRSVVRCRFWLPEGALEKYPNRPYAQWKRQGILTVVPGGVLSPLEIADDVHKTAVDWGLAEIAYDKTFAQDLARDLEGRGLVMVDCRQGFFLNEALVSLSTQVAKGQLAHGGHAILSWMAANSVFIPGRYGDVRLDKLSSKEKIDGIAALAMAESRVILRPEPPKFQMLFVGR